MALILCGILMMIIHIQSRNLIITPTTSECYSAFECIEHTLSSTYIECAGDLSCESSRITSPNAAGYIECSGNAACKRSALESDGSIHCDGHESCYYTDYLVANDEISCAGAYSCFNMNGVTDPYIQSMTSNILCHGAASCLNANIVSYLHTYCAGDQSCSSANIRSGDSIYCDGNISCQQSELMAKSTIYCGGSYGCNNAKIKSHSLHLFGYYAAFQSEIYANTIKAFGNYAFAHSVIDSRNQTLVNIESYGVNSGYGANIICRSGSQCDLKCKNSGCAELVFLCLSGSQCTVSPNVCDQNNIVATYEGTDCPKWYISPSGQEDDEYFDMLKNREYKDENETSAYHISDHLEIDIADNEFNENENEQNDATHLLESHTMIRCGEYQECNDAQYIGEQYIVYCSGSESCTSATIQNLQSENEESEQNAINTINCLGERGCSKANLSGSGNIRCGAQYSCQQAMAINGYAKDSRIECFGHGSCESIKNVINGNEIQCHGTSSCKSSHIESNDYIQCDGFESCIKGNLQSTDGMISCDASSSCSYSTMNAHSNNVFCFGSDSCSNSIIRGALLHFGGSQSGFGSTLYAGHIVALGYKSLQFSLIDSVHKDHLLVEAFGYFAGNRATVLCRRGSVCELECESNGCFKMEMICLDGAQCTVSPIECMTNSENSKDDAFDHIVNGIDCPILKKSQSQKEDEILLKKNEKNRKMGNSVNNIKMYQNRDQNAQYVAMVMENEIVPRQYHRIWLYVAIIVSIAFMCCIPLCFYLHFRLFEEDQNEEELGYNDIRAVQRLLLANKQCTVY